MITAQQKIELPKIDGIKVRAFEMEKDLPALVNLLNVVAESEQTEEYSSVEEVRNIYEHAANCDFTTDFIVVEVKDQLVGFQRVSWRDLPLDNHLIYIMTGSVHPDWYNHGIGTALADWAETRLKEISKNHEQSKKKYFHSSAWKSAEHRTKFLENRNFEPERYFYIMERKDLRVLPSVALPSGIVLRSPASEADWRKAADCLDEAFRDHWGYVASTENDFQMMIHNPHIRADLTQFAWKENEVIGTLIVYINEETNQKTNSKRGWTEDISVRKPYRGQGIAKAMIFAALQAVKSAGMESAMLGVDTNNPNGALSLYENCGYDPIRTSISYRKPLISE
jgi:ribosomal protein S18 acetylase RimI-like enzyme